MQYCKYIHLLNPGTWRGGEGSTIPRAAIHYGGVESLRGRRKVPTLSQVLSSIQYICFRKTLGLNMGAPNLCLAPCAIYPRNAPGYNYLADKALFWLVSKHSIRVISLLTCKCLSFRFRYHDWNQDTVKTAARKPMLANVLKRRASWNQACLQ